MKRILISVGLLLVVVVACNGQVTTTPDSGRAKQVSGEQSTDGQVRVDASRATRSYSNFSRVSGTTEEIIIDFGMNTEPIGMPKDPIKIDHQVVMNFYTAKRLVAALQLSIERHEKFFGEIETDPQKRMKERR